MLAHEVNFFFVMLSAIDALGGRGVSTKKKVSDKTRQDMRFCAVESPFCDVRVEGAGTVEKHQFLMSWLECWLRFQTMRAVCGAVVFDIDGTLIDEAGRPNHSVVALYKTCKELNLQCCIVTARPETAKNRRNTASMLRENGIDDWESLYMMPSVHDGQYRGVCVSVLSAYKRQCRDDIETRHRILANIGDMWHDLMRFPLHGPMLSMKTRDLGECGIFFPPMSHGEVAVKLMAEAGAVQERGAKVW